MITRFPLVSLNMDAVLAGVPIHRMSAPIVGINPAGGCSHGLKGWS